MSMLGDIKELACKTEITSFYFKTSNNFVFMRFFNIYGQAIPELYRNSIDYVYGLIALIKLDSNKYSNNKLYNNPGK